MKKIKIISLMIASVLIFGSMCSVPAHAGVQINNTAVMSGENGLNASEWYFIGDIGYDETKKVMTIPADTSNETTRFISKNVSRSSEEVNDMSTVDASLKLTALPDGKQVIFAFGLGSIEGMSGESGNVEICVANDKGIKLSAKAYEGDKETTILEPKSVGISLNKEFQFSATITNKRVLIVKINGSVVCQKSIPISGEGRFGVLQTGGCGMVFSKLDLINNTYERPENTNVVETFDNGDFDSNQLCAAMLTVGLAPGSHTVTEYKGNQVFMIKNAELSYIGTKYQYSNFEISFDIPYWPSRDLLNEEWDRVQLGGVGICIGWGESVQAPISSASYSEDIDVIELNKISATSYLQKKFTVNYDVEGMPTKNDDEGYSVKFSFVDGHAELQVKPLKAKTYTTVQVIEYEDIRSGYVKLWTLNGGTLAIDNLKITNKDINPNVIEVERQSSKTTFADYDITQESTELVFRPDDTEEETEKGIFADTKGVIFLVAGGAQAVVLVVVGVVIYNVKKLKKKGGSISEKE